MAQQQQDAAAEQQEAAAQQAAAGGGMTICEFRDCRNGGFTLRGRRWFGAAFAKMTHGQQFSWMR
jgi:hypothetical protein